MRTRDYRAAARAVLQGKWLKMVAIVLLATLLGGTIGIPSPTNFDVNMSQERPLEDLELYGFDVQFVIVTAVIIVAVVMLISLFVGSYVTVGLAALGNHVLDGENPRAGMLFPKGVYWKAVGMYLMRSLLIFLWSMLFVIPGIFAAYNYSMADYILYTHPEMGVMEVLQESKKRMYGHRMGLLLLELSFIGWVLLATLPSMAATFVLASPSGRTILGIGILVSFIANLFVQTYMHISFIAYFRNVDRASIWKNQAQEGEDESTHSSYDGEEFAGDETIRTETASRVDESAARSLFMEYGCSRTRLREAGALEEYEQMNIDSSMEMGWIRDYAQDLMLRFNRDALILDKLLLLAGEYSMDDLASRVLERIERHARQQTLPDAEILNMAGRVLALLVSGAFAGNEGFVQRKKQQVSDLADRLAQRLEKSDADGWRDSLQLIRRMCE